MATLRSSDAICRIVEDRILELETDTEARSKPNYNGVVIIDGMLLVIYGIDRNLKVYNGHDGKLISTSHRLKSTPIDVCLISKNEVAVCLWNGMVVILSLKSIDDLKLLETLDTGFDYHSLAKWNSDKLVVSGKKDGKLCWGILSIRDGCMDSTHDICKGGWTHIAVKDNTVYISCWSSDSITKGVYAYDIFKPQTKKFLYQHQELKDPWSIMTHRDCVYVCDCDSNSIHQLTDSGKLVTIHTVSSKPFKIFYDDQHGLLYTTSYGSNVITVYKMESLHQPDSVIPAEVLNMDTRSLQMYKEALNDGKEKVYNIRVMVVGQYGVGKTTLTQRLLGKNVNISERHCTDGIDVHVECSKVSLPAGEWITQEKNAEKYSRLQRLVKLLNERIKNHDSEGKQDSHVKVVDMVASKEHDNVHPQHDHLVSAERNFSQEVKPPPSQPVQSPIARVDPESNIETGAKKNEKDTVMELLQLINENSEKLENSMIEYAALAFWDFAGQYVFYTTHQTFLTNRAIYILVIDLSQQITDLIKDDECFLDMEGIKLCQVHDFIEIWLNSIHSCEPTSHPGIPPVILVGTHVDRIPEKFRQEVILEYFLKIRQLLKHKPIVLHLMDSIAIDNTQCDPNLNELKRRILELASKQPYWGEEKPARWIPLEQALMTLKASGVKVVPLSLIEETNRSASVRIKDIDELELFLIFQHEIGTILYFSAEGLREKIVLDPQWMIDALRSLITTQMFIMQNPAIIKKWYAFREKGKLTDELIDAVWTKEEKPDFHDNKEHIILVMEKLNIIARPMSYTEDGKSVKVPTVMEGIGEGKESKVSEKGKDASVERVLSSSIQNGNTDIQDQILPQVHDVRAKTKSVPDKHYQSTGLPCSDPKLLCQILQKSQQAASSSLSILEANCLSMGLELHGNTPANGNCFFEAVSSQLRRLNGVVQKSPQELRQEVVAFMKTNRVIQASEGTIHLDSFIYNESFDVYCTCMARDGEWADHVVVVAMARMLQIDIMIVTSSPLSGPEDMMVWVAGQTAFQRDPILLGHVWESHYMSLQPIAPLVLDQDLAGHTTQAQIYVSIPSPTAKIMQIPTSGSTSSTAGGLIQTPTTHATPSLSYTTAGVMQTAKSSFIRTDLMQASSCGSTKAVVQAPPSVHTTTDVLLATSSASTPSTTTSSTPCLTPTSTKAVVVQDPSSVSNTTDFMQALASGSKLPTPTGYTPCPTSSSTTAHVMQAPKSASTTDIMQPTSSSSTANAMQAMSSGSTTADILQSTASGSKANVMQALSSGSTSSNVIQTPTSGSTAAKVIQTPTSGSTTADVIQAPSVDDTDRFMHIACLLVNVGSRVLRRLLLYHTVTLTCTLDQYLSKKRIDIDSLRKRKILNKSQMDILFPPGGSTNLGEYDITLLSALFTNIVSTISQKQLNMIHFLRDKRNEIFAHARSVTVNLNDYQAFWNDICRVLESLSKQCGDPDFENEISREIQGIQVSTVLGSSLLDTLQTHPRRMETLERLVQDLISSHTQELKKESEDSDS